MNSVEITSVVPQTEDDESPAIEKFDKSRPPATHASSNARLRYSLLLGITLLLAWLAFSVQSSFSEINAEIEMIHANLLSPR